MSRSNVKSLMDAARQFARAGRWEQSLTSFRAAAEAEPGNAEANYSISAILQQSGILDESLVFARRASEASPKDAKLRFHLGNVHLAMGSLPEAAAEFEQAVALEPRLVEGWMNLAIARADMGKWEAGLEHFKHALSLNSAHPDVHSNLGALLLRMGRAAEAIEHCRRALALQPKLKGVHMNLANALSRTGQADEAIGVYREGLKLDPENTRLCGGLIFALYYRGEEATGLRQEHAACVPRIRDGGRQAFANANDPQKPLRIGYLSPDFRDHAISFFIEPILEKHKRPGFEVYCYSQKQSLDAIGQRLKGYADQWRTLHGLKAAEAAALIREDGIDILVDLAQHSLNNRLDVLAQKPAPVQIAYLGYPGTTGLATVDYVLLDQVLAGGSARQLCVEEVWELEGPYFCYRPRGSPLIPELPAKTNGHVTIGSFNNFNKISSEALAMWARVLTASPMARMRLKAVAFEDTSARTFVINSLKSQGIDPDRLELHGPTAVEDYLRMMGEVDIMLDAYPFNGGTTTCHSLWMGVPVISRTGHLPTGRMGKSILQSIGLGELAVDNADDFVRTAVNLAEDWEELSQLRATLRQRMQSSPLMNEELFLKRLEAAYRGMWRRWCTSSSQ